ncbi:helix-turn-helix domain-containing protein [Yersinia intermedia]|uniref:helix-turn-helix domain-containing protein n=1 Tax=Yersinia intermedia TaxID=631 RepID=UPI0022448E64|nr:helix-turn-helix transcriptional regulator [Yersinia intermedia]MCW8111909.1 helix-turn-helix domain-containing protein [Yersinia intermedia]MDA5516909.1 helix-turn-helix transcriptional regulator [Yersinia intermedia]
MINRALKTIRLFHNIKQSELADKLCISKSYLSELESGKKTVSFDILEKYSNNFDIPVSSLFFFAERINEPGKDTIPEKFKTVFADKILKIMEWSIARDGEKEREN